MSENTILIGERRFYFAMLPAVEAVKVQVAIANVIGVSLFKAFMDPKKLGSTLEEAKTASETALAVLVSKMDSETLISTMERVFNYVRVDNQRVDINHTFTGLNKELWQVFIAAICYNFSDFLPEGLFASL